MVRSQLRSSNSPLPSLTRYLPFPRQRRRNQSARRRAAGRIRVLLLVRSAATPGPRSAGKTPAPHRLGTVRTFRCNEKEAQRGRYRSTLSTIGGMIVTDAAYLRRKMPLNEKNAMKRRTAQYLGRVEMIVTAKRRMNTQCLNTVRMFRCNEKNAKR